MIALRTSAGGSLRPRVGGLDRPVLVADLVSGALWLVVPAALGAWPLSLVGAVYVVAMSAFLARVYARPSLTAREEALAWATPWLVAVALWTWVLTEGDTSTSDSTAPALLVVLGAGLLLGTACFVAWQVSALAVRQLLVWRSGDVTRR